jgi:hypothetical protein
MQKYGFHNGKENGSLYKLFERQGERRRRENPERKP